MMRPARRTRRTRPARRFVRTLLSFAAALTVAACVSDDITSTSGMTRVATTAAAFTPTQLSSTGVPMQIFGPGVMRDINDAGVITGDRNGLAAVWHEGVPTTIPLPLRYGWRINNDGVIVGGGTPSGFRGIRYMNGVQTVLEPPERNTTLNRTEALGINSAGVIVGASTGTEGVPRAARWDDGVVSFITPSPGGNDSKAYDINDHGWIVGATNFFTGLTRAFLVRDGALTLLPNLESGCEATAINNPGQIAGHCRLVSGRRVPVIWTDPNAPPTVLYAAAVSIFTLDINDAGQVVAWGDAIGIGTTAWIFQDGLAYNLGSHNGSFSQAYGMNEAGLVAGHSAGEAAVWQAPPLDRTPPVITFTGAATYGVDQDVNVQCAVTDPPPSSGLASSYCPTASGPAHTFALGAHTLHASAADRAGNQSSASFTFTITVSAASLGELVKRWVEHSGIERSLLAMLDAGAMTGFVAQVQAQSGRHIPADRAAQLIALAQRL